MENNPPVKRLALTVAILAMYKLIGFVPLPILDIEALRELMPGGLFGHSGYGGILALGVMPFFIGFFLVELYSLITSRGRRIRQNGMIGRKKLNERAISLAFLICIVQGLATTFAMEGMTTLGGLTLVPSPGWTSRIIAIVTLTAASGAAFVMCNLITVRGMGNGFCLLILMDFSTSLVLQWDSLSKVYDLETARGIALYLIAFLAIVLIFVYFQKNPTCYQVPLASLDTIKMIVPYFPQGLLAIVWSYSLLNLPGTLFSSNDNTFTLDEVHYLIGMIVAVPLLSIATVHLFSTRARIEYNLPAAVLPENLESLLKRRVFMTTATLTLAVGVFTSLEIHVFSQYYLPGFVELAMVAAIGVDLHGEWRFRSRHPTAERLIELDNVHLALYVSAVLQGRGIACLVQSCYFRSLFFFFRPLYKMVVLVPADCLTEAREEVESIDARIV